MRFAETELRDEAWDPLAWVYLLGDGIHLAPRPRVRAPRRPAGLGRRADRGDPGRPRRGARAADRAPPSGRSAASTPRSPSPSSPGSRSSAARRSRPPPSADEEGELAPVRARLEPAVAAAEAALDGFASHLRDVVLPAAEGEGRLGPDLFAAKLRHTLRVEMTPDELEARARREFDAVRGGDGPPRARAVADAPPGRAAARRRGRPRPRGPRRDRRRATGVRTSSSTSAARSWAGSRRSAASANVVGLADEPLVIELDAASSCAPSAGRCSARPGPLDRGLRSYFYVTPIAATTGRPSRSSRTCARTTTGCS